MIIRSQAPFRLGLAGGGTDVSPYSDIYGGAVLNATINLYAYSTLIPRSDNKIVINLVNKSKIIEFESLHRISTDNEAIIPAEVYNRIVRSFTGEPLSFELSIYVDAPSGSGLGSSSTLLVSVLGAFKEWLNLPLSEYDISSLAWEIERVDLGMAGGKQDQYAATFGGFNYMEFYDNHKVIINPLRIKSNYMLELAQNLLLYYTGTSRLSSNIISEQIENVENNATQQIEAMHQMKEQARQMKEALLKGEFNKMGEILNFGWMHKKKMASRITNNLIDKLYDAALRNGATGGKISGAGGGGYLILYCPELTRYNVIDALKGFNGKFENFEFTDKGLTTWTIH